MQENDLDLIISPNGFGEKPPKIDDIINPKTNLLKKNSPVYEYKHDYYTVIANTLGVPAITMPLFENDESKAKYDNFPGSIRL